MTFITQLFITQKVTEHHKLKRQMKKKPHGLLCPPLLRIGQTSLTAV